MNGEGGEIRNESGKKSRILGRGITGALGASLFLGVEGSHADRVIITAQEAEQEKYTF